MTTKLDLPRSDNFFHLANEIRGLRGTDACRDVAQAAHFAASRENRIKEFLIETGENFPNEDAARVFSQGLDKDTLGRVEDDKIEFTNYQDVKTWTLENEI